MPLFTLKSYHHTACTVGSGMKRERERCWITPPYLFFCIQFPERERTSEYTFEILSYCSCTAEFLLFFRHSRRKQRENLEKKKRKTQPCLSFFCTEGNYNETHSSIVESLIIHCGSFAGEPYHITI